MMAHRKGGGGERSIQIVSKTLIILSLSQKFLQKIHTLQCLRYKAYMTTDVGIIILGFPFISYYSLSSYFTKTNCLSLTLASSAGWLM